MKTLLGIPAAADVNLRPYTTLLVNLVTQLFCVSGVNQMTSVRHFALQLSHYRRTKLTSGHLQRISSVSTNIVLTTRKALSLLFSVWWFGPGWNSQMMVGAAMVMGGTVLYTAASSQKSPTPSSKEEKRE